MSSKAGSVSKARTVANKAEKERRHYARFQSSIVRYCDVEGFLQASQLLNLLYDDMADEILGWDQFVGHGKHHARRLAGLLTVGGIG